MRIHLGYGPARHGARPAGAAALPVAVLVAVLLALAGCGSGNGTAAAPPADTGTAAPGGGGGTAPLTSAPASGVPTGSGAGSGSGPGSGGGASTPAGPDRCHTSQLTGSLHGLDAAAGQRYATLTLTNHTGVTCRIDGYGGIQLVTASGATVPTEQSRDATAPPKLITLAPKASASSQLHWTVVPSDRDPSQTGQCEPTPGALRVIPPDETDALQVKWTLGVVCDHGRIVQQAYRAGTGTG